MRANFVMKVSLRLLRSLAFSTRLIIFVAVDSPKVFVTLARSTPEMFTHPDTTLSPTVTSRGILSPVSATVLSADAPAVTTASSGTRSPGRISIVSPTSTLSGDTVVTSSPRTTLAVSGRMSMSCDMERRLRCSA